MMVDRDNGGFRGMESSPKTKKQLQSRSPSAADSSRGWLTRETNLREGVFEPLVSLIEPVLDHAQPYSKGKRYAFEILTLFKYVYGAVPVSILPRPSIHTHMHTYITRHSLVNNCVFEMCLNDMHYIDIHSLLFVFFL